MALYIATIQIYVIAPDDDVQAEEAYACDAVAEMMREACVANEPCDWCYLPPDYAAPRPATPGEVEVYESLRAGG